VKRTCTSKLSIMLGTPTKSRGISRGFEITLFDLLMSEA
jgi:hypothetical protein